MVAAATAVVAVAESVNAKHALKSHKAKGSYFHSGGGSLAISHKTYRPHKPYPHPHPPCRLSDFAIIHDLRAFVLMRNHENLENGRAKLYNIKKMTNFVAI